MGFFNRKKKSRNVAKDRLKLVLIHDRANCNTELLESMRADIIKVIRNYMEFDETELDLHIGTTQSETSESVVPALYANIPIKNMRKPH